MAASVETHGLEVLQLNEEKPFEIRLTNGNKVLIHEQEAYGDFYTGGRSFEDVKGKQSDAIRFEYDFKIHKDGLKELKEENTCIRSNPMAVYHGHIMWTYQYQLSVVKKTDDDLLCSFETLPIGPSFTKKTAPPKGAYGTNAPERQSSPEAKNVKLCIVGETGEVDVPLECRDGVFRARSLLSINNLRLASCENSFILLRISLNIDKSYFDLSKIIDLKINEPTAPESSRNIVATIVRGEKPPQWDWVITIGEGSPSEYYVHRKVLADASPIFDMAIRTHSSMSQGLLMVSHEDRFILPGLHAEDMDMFLSFVYLRRHELPVFDGFARVGRVLSTLFPRQLSSFLENWEKKIILDAMKLDKSESKKTQIACVRHLISIFSAPYGAMPVAKRVAISVLADTMSLGKAREKDEEEFDPVTFFKMPIVESIMHSVNKFKTVVAGIDKSYA